MAVRMEVFSGDPPCPGCIEIIRLCESVAGEYGPEVDFTVYKGEAGLEKFTQYKMFCVPAVVVNGYIKIEGVVPSRPTLLTALREGGLCLR